MNCAEVRRKLVEMWDLKEEDPQIQAARRHVQQCPQCANEWEAWKQSQELIQFTYRDESPARRSGTPASIADSVMRRIYQDESWRIPVPNRMYHISFRLRRQLTLLMSIFLAMFIVSLYFALAEHFNEEPVLASHMTVAVPVATAEGTFLAEDAETSDASFGMPVASISDPILVRGTPIQTDPNYWVAISIVGIVSVLLIMNWLSRIRA